MVKIKSETHPSGKEKASMAFPKHPLQIKNRAKNDGVTDLASKAFTPTYVHDHPKINTDRVVWGGKENLKGSNLKDEEDLKEDLLIRDLCTQETDSIHDKCVVNTDASSYLSKIPKSISRLLRRRRGIILRPASNIVVTSLPLSPQCMDLLGWMRRRNLSVSPSTSQQSGRIPTHVPTGT